MLKWLFSAPLSPGTPAPAFDLPDDSGRRWRLSDLAGEWVLLVFYPGDDTMVCTRQLCALRDEWQSVQQKGVRCFGVNPQGEDSHRKFREKYRFPFPLLIDTDGEVAGAYLAGGWIIRRTVYLIGPDGRIRFGERGVPDVASILAEVS